MNDLMDNFARILATPMPRRKAFKLFGGALAAAVVAVGRSQSAYAKPGPVTCPQKGCKGLYACSDGKCYASPVSSLTCTTKPCG
jgi:hypothetical protein